MPPGHPRGEHVLVPRPEARHYALRCRACNRVIEDDGFVLGCPSPHEPAFLVADYHNRRFQPDRSSADLFRFHSWLPIGRRMAGVGSGATYRSERLARAAGLDELWIAFNGWWPERGATLATGTFKELEAWTVLARLPQRPAGTLVIASAGNTAAAFARACSLAEVACLIIVPESGLAQVLSPEERAPWVKLVVLDHPADYADAIALAGWLAEVEKYYPEGGVRNVARRAGLGTVLLDALDTMGRLPDYYFQAVGSGAGAIGVFEAAERLVEDGGFGDQLPRLMLSQNHPFTPLYDSWRTGSRVLVRMDAEVARRRAAQILTPVLSNRQPPYAILGGVYDALHTSGGDMLAVDNAAARQARALFEEHEGIDIDPAGAVALASLLQAARDGRIAKGATVLLNVTGGGRERRLREGSLRHARPDVRIARSEIRRSGAVEMVGAL
ncbi:MAG: cysteate synthase [Gemmatimonadales bacterium]|nr:cysteate synthase [Gemmatimonadales bacterium]